MKKDAQTDSAVKKNELEKKEYIKPIFSKKTAMTVAGNPVSTSAPAT